MSSSKRYKDLANHLNNTLGVTKEFVRDYVRAVVEERVTHWLEHHFATSTTFRRIVAHQAERFFNGRGRNITSQMMADWSVELEETTRRFLARKREG